MEQSLATEHESKLAEKQAAEKKYSVQEEEYLVKVQRFEQQIKELVSWVKILVTHEECTLTETLIDEQVFFVPSFGGSW